jgi:putative hydrolase of the HAD superfamily
MEFGLRGILVDLDETLYSREGAFWSWIETEAEAALAIEKLDREKVAKLDACGRGDKHLLLEYLDSSFGWGHAHERRLERFRSGVATAARLGSGVRESLVRVAGEYKLGLVTNGTSATQRAKLRALCVDDLFNPIVISEEVGLRKPDIGIFELAIADWGIAAESVLFVGDDPVSDIAGATAAGMHTLRVGQEDGIPSIAFLEQWLQRRG